jgi:hypothetical protein
LTVWTVDCEHKTKLRDALLLIAAACPHLHTLELAGESAPLTVKQLTEVAEACPSLKNLFFYASRPGNADALVLPVARTLPRLTVASREWTPELLLCRP